MIYDLGMLILTGIFLGLSILTGLLTLDGKHFFIRIIFLFHWTSDRGFRLLRIGSFRHLVHQHVIIFLHCASIRITLSWILTPMAATSFDRYLNNHGIGMV